MTDLQPDPRSKTEIKTARLRYAGDEAFIGFSQTGHAVVTSFAGQNPAAPTPMELLLISLGGCAGADIVSILEKKRQRVTGYEIEIRAERREEHPRIYTRIEVLHKLRGKNIDPKAAAHAVELSETKYCSVSAMLGAAAQVSMRIEIIDED
jgi:putative redox protein